jgi:hypothetical protein
MATIEVAALVVVIPATAIGTLENGDVIRISALFQCGLDAG